MIIFTILHNNSDTHSLRIANAFWTLLSLYPSYTYPKMQATHYLISQPTVCCIFIDPYTSFLSSILADFSTNKVVKDFLKVVKLNGCRWSSNTDMFYYVESDPFYLMMIQPIYDRYIHSYLARGPYLSVLWSWHAIGAEIDEAKIENKQIQTNQPLLRFQALKGFSVWSRIDCWCMYCI